MRPSIRDPKINSRKDFRLFLQRIYKGIQVFFSKIHKMIDTSLTCPQFSEEIYKGVPVIFTQFAEKVDKMTVTLLSCSKFLNEIRLDVKAGYFDVKIGHFLVNVFTVTV